MSDKLVAGYPVDSDGYRVELFVAALILVLAIGVKYGANDDIALGPIHLSGLAIAAIVGIFLNAIMPDKLGMKVKSFKGKEKS